MVVVTMFGLDFPLSVLSTFAHACVEEYNSFENTISEPQNKWECESSIFSSVWSFKCVLLFVFGVGCVCEKLWKRKIRVHFFCKQYLTRILIAHQQNMFFRFFYFSFQLFVFRFTVLYLFPNPYRGFYVPMGPSVLIIRTEFSYLIARRMVSECVEIFVPEKRHKGIMTGVTFVRFYNPLAPSGLSLFHFTLHSGLITTGKILTYKFQSGHTQFCGILVPGNFGSIKLCPSVCLERTITPKWETY